MRALIYRPVGCAFRKTFSTYALEQDPAPLRLRQPNFLCNIIGIAQGDRMTIIGLATTPLNGYHIK